MDNSQEYRDLARQLIEIVNQGTFVLVDSSCALQDLLAGQWPADMLRHEFRCTECHRVFRLFADTYHGFSSWTPVDDAAK